MSHAGTEDKFVKTLFPENMEGLKVLDVGCGYGATGLYIRTRTYNQGWCELHGLEKFKDYYELQKKLGIYDQLYHADALEVPQPGKYFDLSIGQHVIEHLKKEDGFKMLEEMERVTKDRVIICTPNGYTESGPLDGNLHNNHLSGWSLEDFRSKGYKVKIINKNVNSRLLVTFAKLVFWLQRKRWDNEVIVAWKDLQ